MQAGGQDEIIAKLAQANEALQEKLAAYKALEEDLAAQRVFEKARKRLGNWITVGGIAAFVGGIVGFRAVIDYSKELVTAQLKSVARERIESAMLEEGKKQIAALAASQRQDLLAFAEQQKTQLSIAGSPLALRARSPAAASETGALPASVDYSPRMLAVRDQGQEGSGVSFAVAAALEYQIAKTLREEVRVSPRFIYYYARSIGKLDVKADSGAKIRDAVAVVSTMGGVDESAWPYRPGEFAIAPPGPVAGARHYKVDKAVPLNNVAAFKTALASYGPVIAGISMYQAMTEAAVAKTGRVPMPKAGEQILGGHAVCLVGYDDGKQQFKFRNSWGTGWGDGGYGYLPYAYLAQLSSDSWAISM